MALGDVAPNVGNAKRAVKILDGATASNGAPTLATDGVPCYPTNKIVSDDGVCYTGRPSSEASIFLKCTGTTPTVTARLWGYLAALGEWVPVGTGTDTDKGKLNAGAAMGAVKTNKVLHAEPFLMAGHFDRLYLEVTLGGTTPSCDAWIVVPIEIC